MTLAEEVRDTKGRILLPAGSELTDKHITAFRAWGVTSVVINSSGEGEDEALDAETLQEIERAADLHFRHNDLMDPFVKELRRLHITARSLEIVRQRKEQR
jgi:hypothetical protein